LIVLVLAIIALLFAPHGGVAGCEVGRASRHTMLAHIVSIEWRAIGRTFVVRLAPVVYARADQHAKHGGGVCELSLRARSKAHS